MCTQVWPSCNSPRQLCHLNCWLQNLIKTRPHISSKFRKDGDCPHKLFLIIIIIYTLWLYDLRYLQSTTLTLQYTVWKLFLFINFKAFHFAVLGCMLSSIVGDDLFWTWLTLLVFPVLVEFSTVVFVVCPC